MLNYSEAISAVEGGEFACRMAWPINLYIGLSGSTIELYNVADGSTQYVPTSADESATDWIKGTDRPPKR